MLQCYVWTGKIFQVTQLYPHTVTGLDHFWAAEAEHSCGSCDGTLCLMDLELTGELVINNEKKKPGEDRMDRGDTLEIRQDG